MRSIPKSIIAVFVVVGVTVAARAQESDPQNAERYRKAWMTGDRSLRTDIAPIEKEMGIMAKVLEESIDKAGIDDWRGGAKWTFYTPYNATGPGGSAIHYRYIPTVGVVFTVQVAFPIRSTAKYSEEEVESDDESPDLWKKFERSTARFDIESKGPITVITDKDGVRSMQFRDVRIEEFKSTRKVDEENKRQSGGGGHAGQGGIGAGGGLSGLNVGGGGGRGAGGGGGFGGGGVIGDGGEVAIADPVRFDAALPEYDEVKVEKLRSTLIETIAQYGHRMDHLPADDRIIVIVESGLHGQVPVLGYFFGNQQGSSDTIPYGRSTARYQFSVRKSDLSSETTGAALEGKVEEIKY